MLGALPQSPNTTPPAGSSARTEPACLQPSRAPTRVRAVALDQPDDELDDVLSGNVLQRGVSRGPPRVMTPQDALLQITHISSRSGCLPVRRQRRRQSESALRAGLG